MKNTVCLPLERYHELLNAEKSLEKKLDDQRPVTIVRHNSLTYTTVQTDDVAVKALAEMLKEKSAKLEKCQNDISDLKIMTKREFKKWRNEPNNRL
jgi:PHD/YefM family antitoxin component YafN of YafNO toxin-antitoxin module